MRDLCAMMLLVRGENMEKFITGVLVQNKAGATYEDVVYDRRLMIRLPDSHELSIFDFADPISTELHTDEVYTMVLIPFVVSVNLVLAPSLSGGIGETTKSNSWQGTVIDSNWEAPKDAFHLVRAELYEQRWLLVATSYGNLILKLGIVEMALSAGTVIQWENTRLDLYAVV